MFGGGVTAAAATAASASAASVTTAAAKVLFDLMPFLSVLRPGLGADRTPRYPPM